MDQNNQDGEKISKKNRGKIADQEASVQEEKELHQKQDRFENDSDGKGRFEAGKTAPQKKREAEHKLIGPDKAFP